ncbi:hypothetical protein [Streptomyces sp. NPDC058394]|uniref:hypothetical protein n=1 Tax=unclassified Streptomyces TaxID=2593676 RepID=UPI003657A698
MITQRVDAPGRGGHDVEGLLDELYIAGRSKMSRDELIDALARAGHRRSKRAA